MQLGASVWRDCRRARRRATPPHLSNPTGTLLPPPQFRLAAGCPADALCQKSSPHSDGPTCQPSSMISRRGRHPPASRLASPLTMALGETRVYEASLRESSQDPTLLAQAFRKCWLNAHALFLHPGDAHLPAAVRLWCDVRPSSGLHHAQPSLAYDERCTVDTLPGAVSQPVDGIWHFLLLPRPGPARQRARRHHRCIYELKGVVPGSCQQHMRPACRLGGPRPALHAHAQARWDSTPPAHSAGGPASKKDAKYAVQRAGETGLENRGALM